MHSNVTKGKRKSFPTGSPLFSFVTLKYMGSCSSSNTAGGGPDAFRGILRDEVGKPHTHGLIKCNATVFPLSLSHSLWRPMVTHLCLICLALLLQFWAGL